MEITSINIHNFKGIKNLKKEINGKNVYLVGGNGQGKTSFIDAVFCGLTGKNIPAEPTHNGAKKGLIEIDLGDFIARTKFTKGRPTRFELENKNFESEADRFIKSPRSFLEKKIGVINFDVNEFLSKSDAEKIKYFAKIMNLDFSDIDADIEEAVESRRFDKKKLKEIDANRGYFDDETAKKEIVSVLDIQKEIDAVNGLKTQINDVEKGVKDRQDRLKSILLEAETLKKEITDGEIWIKDSSVHLPTDDEFKKLIHDRDNSEKTNESIREAQKYKKAETDFDALEKQIEDTNVYIQEKRELKADRISKNINIDGLTYDVNSERFLFNGLPFENNQINTSAQLVTGLKIASMSLKDLRIVKVDASLIDKDHFEDVIGWAEENDISLFIELVDRENTQLKIIVHDENE